MPGRDVFPGFSSPNGTIVPDEFFDVLMPQLSESELRVLLYIIRRTLGFKKHADTISLKQMTDGITTRDGAVLDRGTGLSKASAARGVKRLLERGIIVVKRNRSAHRGFEPTTYTLRFKDDPAPLSHRETHNKQEDNKQTSTVEAQHNPEIRDKQR
jgi:hypothetical protein